MKLLLRFAIFIQSMAISAQNIYFVNQGVSGGQQTGLNWADAFADLQPALAAANAGDSIWVAQGTYFPTTTTDRSVSFVLKRGLKLYGGFLGTETSITQRDFGLNETILSGNIGASHSADNTYHVLYGAGLDSSSVLDGFVVMGGRAADGAIPDSDKGGGLLLEPSQGLYNSNPIIQNCRFIENYAIDGGAIYCHGTSGSPINPIIRNCQFVANRCLLSGGAIYKKGPALPEEPFVLEHCIFLKNAAFAGNGGAVCLMSTENTTLIRDCSFEQDSTKGGWAAGVFFELTDLPAGMIVERCGFRDNHASESSAISMRNPIAAVGANYFLHVTACDFRNNVADTGSAIGISGSAIEDHLDIRISKSRFLNNRSNSLGSVMLISAFELDLEINECEFMDNVSLSGNTASVRYAVAIGGRNVRSTISNCLFARNAAALRLVVANSSAFGTHNVTNCTFYRNGTHVIYKSNYLTGSGYNNCYVTNCIFEETTTYDRMFSDNVTTSAVLEGYHIDYNFLSLDENVTPNALFGPNTVFNAQPFFVDTVNNDFRLQDCSPAVNWGNNLAIDTLGVFSDLDGNPRIRFGTVDLGAYETQDSCLIIRAEEPLRPKATALLYPNPATASSRIETQVFGMGWTGRVSWVMRDAFGRSRVAGNAVLDEQGRFSVAAPESPGVYFVEIRSGTNVFWTKMVVQY